MKNIYKSISAASVAMLVFSCKPKIDLPAIDKASLDLSSYVAIGSSMTAGYADNALYYKAQQNAYPNLIAKQFQLVGGGEFRQPLVDESSVGIGSLQNARLVLAPVTDCKGATSLWPVYAAQRGDAMIFAGSVSAGPFNNLAVPGLKSVSTLFAGYGDVYRGTGNFNPFFTRMADNSETSSVLSDALAQQPTFFTLSLGNDDVYGYALSGGSGDVITPSAGNAGTGYDASMDTIVTYLTANHAKGAIANIPSPSSLPFFTTIPFNSLLLDATNAAALNNAYANSGVSFTEGMNRFVIADAAAPAGFRQMNEGEYLLLSIPQDSLKCGGWGSLKPIPAQYVLTADEVANVNDAIAAYNNKLHALANEKALAYVDVNAFMKRLQTGITFNGVGYNTAFVKGGVFSLDGVNLTPAGNALLANEFIKAINEKYRSRIPGIDVTKFAGVSFP